jgi:hypothetical protein
MRILVVKKPVFKENKYSPEYLLTSMIHNLLLAMKVLNQNSFNCVCS